MEYFNGIGLIYGKINGIARAANPDEYDEQFQLNALWDYKSAGGKILSHRTYRDSVSLLGRQAGDEMVGNAALDCLEHHLNKDGAGHGIRKAL